MNTLGRLGCALMVYVGCNMAANARNRPAGRLMVWWGVAFISVLAEMMITVGFYIPFIISFNTQIPIFVITSIFISGVKFTILTTFYTISSANIRYTLGTWRLKLPLAQAILTSMFVQATASAADFIRCRDWVWVDGCEKFDRNHAQCQTVC